MLNQEDKFIINAYEIEARIIEHLYKHGGKLRFIEKKHTMNPCCRFQSYTDTDVFKLDDISIVIRTTGGGWGGKNTVILVDGMKFISLYAEDYLTQLLDDVMNNRPPRKTPVQPERTLRLKEILNKCERINEE